MAQIGFLFVTVDPGTEDKVADRIRRMEGVKEAYRIYGSYDIVAKLELDDMSQLKKIVWKARKISGVRDTVTAMSSSKSL